MNSLFPPILRLLSPAERRNVSVRQASRIAPINLSHSEESAWIQQLKKITPVNCHLLRLLPLINVPLTELIVLKIFSEFTRHPKFWV